MNLEFLEIGEGWYSIVQPLFDYIHKYNAGKKKYSEFTKEDEEKGLSPQIEVIQVKEKFGGLRFYTSYTTKELNALIDEAEEKASKTCERCGKKGKLRCRRGWYATLCDECAKELNYDN